MTKQILVPVDGSEASAKALDFAVELAGFYPADLHLVHVVQPLMTEDIFAMGALAIPVDLPSEEIDEYGQRVLEKATDRVRATAENVVLKTQVLSGDPCHAVVAHAEEIQADLIVIGSRGLGELSSLLTGSMSRRVAHECSCTCITVK